jgi:hypothetical protein
VLNIAFADAVIRLNPNHTFVVRAIIARVDLHVVVLSGHEG